MIPESQLPVTTQLNFFLTTADNTGLHGIINVLPLNKNGNIIECAACDITGNSFLFSESSGNTFLAHLDRNRFICVARNLRTCALQFLDHNHVLFALSSIDRNVHIYNDAGKRIEVLTGHKSKVTKIEVNYVKEVFFTLSKDCITL